MKGSDDGAGMERVWLVPSLHSVCGRAAKDSGLQEVHPSSLLGEDPVP